MDLVKVLTLDGGGIRGIIPAMVLAELERRSDKPVWSMFDLIAGTSTGGIIALGLVAPTEDGKAAYSAQQLVDLYDARGSEIFHRSLWHSARALGNILDEKYSASGLEDVLEHFFGDTRLKRALTDVLITSYEIERRLPFFFRSARAKVLPDYDYPMRVVARATSAAPTYFEPCRVVIQNADAEKSGEDHYALVDGGVFANNPAMCAFVEAKNLYPAASRFLVVSIGTGEFTRRIPYDEARDWGLAKWAQPILGVVFDGVSDTVDYQLNVLCNSTDTNLDHYFRFQTALSEGNDDMDDTTRTNLRVLRLLAEQLIRDRSDDLDRLCERLTADVRDK